MNLTLRQTRFLSGQAAASQGGNKLDDLSIEKYNTMQASLNTLNVVRCLQVAAGGADEKTRFLRMAIVTGRLFLTGPGKNRLAPATTAPRGPYSPGAGTCKFNWLKCVLTAAKYCLRLDSFWHRYSINQALYLFRSSPVGG